MKQFILITSLVIFFSSFALLASASNPNAKCSICVLLNGPESVCSCPSQDVQAPAAPKRGQRKLISATAPKKKIIRKTCSVESCTKTSQRKGLCYKHGGKPSTAIIRAAI